MKGIPVFLLAMTIPRLYAVDDPSLVGMMGGGGMPENISNLVSILARFLRLDG